MPALPKARDEKLAQHLAKGILSNQAACKDAGFTDDPKSVNLKVHQRHIQARVAEIRELKAKRELDRELETSEHAAKALGLSKRWVLERLKYQAERCLRGMPVLDANGVQIPGRYSGKPDSAGANKALHLIGLELGMFVERHEIGGPGDFSRLSDAEFDEKLKEEALAAGLPEEAVAGLLTYSPPDESNE